MSIFSETKLIIPGNQTPLGIAVSNTIAMPIVAVAVESKVLFYDENGDKIQYEITK